MGFNRTLIIIFFMVFGTFIVWRVAHYSEKSALEDLIKTGNARAELYATTLRKELDTYRSLPYILARDLRIKDLLEGKGDPFVVNQHLEDYAVTSKAAALYVVSGDGTAIASSNWRAEDSFVGHNYSYRPYFQDALKGNPGNYYAVGVQTRKPGYYISYSVYREAKLLGVVVVKVDLSQLEKTWTELGENVAVSDSHGVFILSSMSDWRYKTLRPLTEKTRKRLQRIQYLDQDLNHAPFIRDLTPFGTQVIVNRVKYLEQSIQLPDLGWRLHYLSKLRPVNQTVHQDSLIATGSVILIAFLFLYLRERRQKIRSRKDAQAAQIIQKTNERLEAEIIVRHEAERHLREMQADLVQAEKLAALGRMSAAIAHELNQPIAAIRTFSASGRKFLERAEPLEAMKNFEMVSQLTDSMASITLQLKIFARKNPQKLSDINLVEILEHVLSFLKPSLDEEGIEITTDFGLSNSMIKADQVRLEQVFTNLIRNAADAVKDKEQKYISIILRETDDSIIIEFKDNGEGIDEENLNRIFDPFFTTKEVGSGLGLGLYISYGIISDLNGSLKATNIKTGGACFSVTFKRTKKT
jgi:two-component system, NtrC family, C4-dicarboxylate transport sensor histidine kinase DctB